MVRQQDSPWSRQIWSVLPGACHNMPAGSIFGRPHRRSQPLCHSCKKGDNYVQRHSVNLTHVESICSIDILPEICFNLPVGCRLCGVFISTRDGNLVWDLPKVHMVVKSLWDLFLSDKMLWPVFLCPPQVSWSDVFSFISPLGQAEQVQWFLFPYFLICNMYTCFIPLAEVSCWKLLDVYPILVFLCVKFEWLLRIFVLKGKILKSILSICS